MKLLDAISKFFYNVITLQAFRTNRAADQVFTNSSDGINAGYSQAIDQMRVKVLDLVKGISGLEVLKISKETLLKDLDSEEIRLEGIIEGILAALDTDPENEEAINDFTNQSSRKGEIDQKQEVLTTEIGDLVSRLQDYVLQLKKYKDEIYKLQQESKEAVADHALAAMEKNLLEKENNLIMTADMSGVDAIRQANAQRKAEVNTLRRSSGADTTKRMDKYAAAGSRSKATGELAEILASRKAKDKASEAGSSTSERPVTESKRKV